MEPNCYPCECGPHSYQPRASSPLPPRASVRNHTAAPPAGARAEGSWPCPLRATAHTPPPTPVYSERGSHLAKMFPCLLFKAPLRPDIVDFAQSHLQKNNRWPCAVSDLEGHQAKTWALEHCGSTPRARGGGLISPARVLLEICVLRPPHVCSNQSWVL